MSTTMDDFTERDGYFIRDMDNGWSEVVRADGHGFGSMANERIDELIAVDKENPAPPTGYRIQDIFEAAPAEDVQPEVVVEDGETEAAEKPARRRRSSTSS